MNALGKAVKKFFASKKAYALLDADREIGGTTWSAGGCAVAATALHQLLPGSELWSIIAFRKPQHVIVEFRGRYYDADGDTTTPLSDFKEREMFGGTPGLIPFRSSHLREIVCPIDLVVKVREELRKVLP